MILVVDSTDGDRMALTRDELHKMVQHPELNKASIIVFANKQVGMDQPVSIDGHEQPIDGLKNILANFCASKLDKS